MSFVLGVDTDNAQITAQESGGKAGSWTDKNVVGQILVAQTGAVLKVSATPSTTVSDYTVLLGTTEEIQSGYEYPSVFRVLESGSGGVDNSDEYYYYDNGGLYPWVPVGTPAPVFSVQPSNQTVTEPDAAVFGPVAASDTTSWQWEAESSPGVWANAETVLLNATGQTTDTLNTGATVDADDTGVRVQATGVGGTTVSTEVTLTVDVVSANFVATFNADAQGFTITRSSDQTGLAVDGIIYTSAANVGVYPGAANSAGWQPDASFKGLLLEGAAENLLADSEDITVGGWSVQGGSAGANTTTAPDGTGSGNTLTDNTATGEHNVKHAWTPPAGKVSISCFAKFVDLVQVGYRQNITGPGFSNVQFDIQAGTVVDAGVYLATAVDTLAAGWFRTLATTGNTVTNLAVIYPGFEAGNHSYTGTSQARHYWGMQAEAGDFATSYIKTSGGTATRATTTCTQTLANMGITPPTNNFSVAVEFELIADRQFYRDDEFCIFELAATSTNRLRLYFDSANDNLVAQKVVNGTPGTAVTHDISDLLRGVVMSVLVEVQSPGGLTLTIDAVQEGNAAGETTDFAAALDTFYLGHNVVGGDNHFAVVKTLTIEPSI